MLVGREEEQERLEAVIEAVRVSASRVLVLRGEAGIGKTSLLSYAAQRAAGLAVLSARGVESEVEIPFAGLLELFRSRLPALDRLPERQAAALRGALGLGPAVGADSRLVGAATLGALTALAEERPLLVLVDDVHWLDPESVAALVFTARRLVADPVGLVFALRGDEPSPLDGAGLPELELARLDAGAARELLRRIAPGRLSAERLVAASGGNPLALVELARDAGGARPDIVDEPLRVGARIERAMGRRLEGLSREARLALLAAATSDGRELGPVLRAARALGGTQAGLEEAEDAGLIRLDPGRLAFGHPLVRSVVYGLAAASERRAAHRALAGALDDGDRRAWHEAAAAVGPDDAVAGRLAQAAARARARGGPAAAAAGFERAARLTPDGGDQARRLHDAAEAAWLAGDAPRALALVDEARPLATEPGLEADLEHLGGHVRARLGPLPPAVAQLCRGADLAVRAGVPEKATEMLAEATYAAFYAGDKARATTTSERAVALAAPGEPRARVMAAIAQGVALVLDADGARGMLAFREVARLVATTPALEEDERLFPCLGVAPLFLRDVGAEFAPLQRAVTRARERGVLGTLPFGLLNLALEAATSHRWAEGAALFGEGIGLAREGGLRVDLAGHLAGVARLEARQGRIEAARQHAREARELSREVGTPLFETWALAALADAAWAAGDVAGTIDALEEKARILARFELRDVDLSPAPELVEAYLRIGRTRDAEAAAAAHAVEAAAKGQPWALARAARAEGLVAADPDFAERFEAAVSAHEQAVDRFELARTRLCFGERLRRAGHRARSRAELRGAWELFAGLGAAPWEAHARSELAATGETVRRRDPAALDELTPQEVRIALRLAQGATTRQVAEALFLSPKTVEYHLRNVYGKLGINSRAALAEALDPDQSSSAMSSAALVAASAVAPR